MSATNNPLAGFATMAVSGRGKGRVTDAERKANATEIISRGVLTYAGQMTIDTTIALANGEKKSAMGREFSVSVPESLACDICHKAHGAPLEGTNNKWRADLMTNNHLLAQNGKLVLISNSCFHQHVKPQLTKDNCKNFADVIARFKK